MHFSPLKRRILREMARIKKNVYETYTPTKKKPQATGSICRKCGSKMLMDEADVIVNGKIVRNVPVERCKNRKCNNVVIPYETYSFLMKEYAPDSEEITIEIYDEDEEIKKELDKYEAVPRIGDIIKEKGISIKSIAKRYGSTPQYIYRLIDGLVFPSIEKAYRLAKILDVPISELYEYRKKEQ